MGTEQSLRGEVRDLRAAVEGLTGLLDDKVTEKVAEVAIPREEYARRVRASGKRTIAGLILVLVLAIGAIAVNRVTLMQAQENFGEQITKCFLRPGAITPAEAVACDRQFSAGGHEYQQIQQRSAQANRQFTDLQRWAKSKGWVPPK